MVHARGSVEGGMGFLFSALGSRLAKDTVHSNQKSAPSHRSSLISHCSSSATRGDFWTSAGEPLPSRSQKIRPHCTMKGTKVAITFLGYGKPVPTPISSFK